MVTIFVRFITVLIFVRFPGNHGNGLTRPRSHRSAGQARPPMLTFRFSAHLDVHLLAHILSVGVSHSASSSNRSEHRNETRCPTVHDPNAVAVEGVGAFR